MEITDKVKSVLQASQEPVAQGGSGVRAAELAVVAVFLFFMAYFSMHWAMEGVIHNRKEQLVPDIRGKSAIAALEILSERGLALKEDGVEFDESVPIGAVLRQVPPSGTTVREGKIIRAVFSQGGETVFIPNLIGLPLRNAELLLRQSQLLLGEVSESYSLKSEKGLTLSQDPKSEASVAKNTLVNVVVSAGPPPAGITLMPDFRQRRLQEATQWASGLGLTLEINEDADSLFPNGTVLGQEPGPDAALSSEVKIVLTVSSRRQEQGNQDLVHRIHYEVSQSGSQSQIRIVMVDRYGEREIFNGFRAPGSKVDLAVPHGGAAKIRVFVNGILVEERESQ